MHKEYSRMGNRRGITSALKKFPESSKHDEMDDKSILIDNVHVLFGVCQARIG